VCGIAGFWSFEEADAAELERVAMAMAATLHSRGPDTSASWTDARTGLGLGHTRLRVIDLSEAGAQPMRSHSGRWVIAYNGEIYNASELRDRLGQRRWRGTSDTEVMLEACEAWGVPEAASRANGMFAFAAFDMQSRRLHLARDRVGIKPLYFGLQNGVLLFASQPRALLAHPSFEPRIDNAVLPSYFAFNCVPAPLSIYESVGKVMPGEVVSISESAAVEHERYWDMRDVLREAAADPIADADGAVNGLEALLADAVGRRMVSDVPLGVFLSGGVDSSVVTALMQRHANRPVRTFTIGFDEEIHNEAPYAKAVASHLGTDHTEVYLGPQHARDVIPDLPQWYDEPFADSSQIPTYLVSRMAREHVTVCLSGDGGDEVFAGYRIYRYGADLLRRLHRIPRWLRTPTGIVAGAVPPAIAGAFPSHLKNLSFKLKKTGAILREKDAHMQYQAMLSIWGERVPGWERFDGMPALDPVEMMQFIDTQAYLPDDILTKVDRASMAVGLEARVPLLDHRLIDYSWRLPLRLRNRKALLKQVLFRHVPPQLIERPKSGFTIPVAQWLRGPLRDWAEDLLESPSLDEVVDARAVRRRWQQHQSQTHSWEHGLWGVLMLQAWRRAWRR